MLTSVLCRRWLAWLMLLPLLALTACLKSASPPDSAPANFSVLASDGQVIVNWDTQPGYTYWIYMAAAPAGTQLTLDNYIRYPGARVVWPAVAGQAITLLDNGTNYVFALAASKDGSKIGPLSASISVVPRPAGQVWTAGVPAGNQDLRQVVVTGTQFVTVGPAGAIYTAPYSALFSAVGFDTWTSRTSGTQADLTALFFDRLNLIALGTGGTVLSSTDGVTWKAGSTGAAASRERFNALAGGGGVYLAVGNNGAIYTGDAALFTATPPANTAWIKQTSNTTQHLNQMVFDGSKYVVVGNGGTILTGVVTGTTGSDGKTTYTTTWTPRDSGTTQDLHGVAFTGTVYIAVGKNGTVLTSADATTWVANPVPTTRDLYAVAVGPRIVIAGAAGTVLTAPSITAAGPNTWALNSTGSAQDVYGLLSINGAYLAVGQAGSNARSF